MVCRGLLALYVLAACAAATVWVGYDGGLAQYDDAGTLIHRYDDYRRPISLLLDRERRRLWFLDAYDYRLVCFDVDRGKELFAVANAATAPSVASSGLKLYVAEKRPVEPSLGWDPGDGSIWVADFYGHQLARYDAAGNELFRVSNFHEPFAVAPVGDGTAWVTGSIRTVALVDAAGKTKLSQAGVNEARALAYDAVAGVVWVADYRNNRVLALDGNGMLKRKVLGVELPFALAVDGPGGVVWVASQYGGVKKIAAADAEAAVDVADSENVTALALDGAGTLWAAVAEEGVVLGFGADGEPRVRITGIKTPTGLAAE
jgi:DNA-binding beta-propeller fold protein YncE